jgi:hypothetical protein
MTEVRITCILAAQAEAISNAPQFSGVIIHLDTMGKSVTDFAKA